MVELPGAQQPTGHLRSRSAEAARSGGATWWSPGKARPGRPAPASSLPNTILASWRERLFHQLPHRVSSESRVHLAAPAGPACPSFDSARAHSPSGFPRVGPPRTTPFILYLPTFPLAVILT